VVTRVDTAPYGVETPNPTGWWLICWDSWSHLHPGRITPHPRIIYPFILLYLRRPGNKNDGSPGRYRLAGCGNPNPRADADWRGFRGAGGIRENRVSSPDHKQFHTSTTPMNRGRKRCSPGLISPRKMWKPPTPPADRWLAGVRGVPPHRGRIDSQPRIRTTSTHLQVQQTGHENGDSSGRYRCAWCGNPQPHWLIADWLGLVEPAASGKHRVPSSDHESFHT